MALLGRELSVMRGESQAVEDEDEEEDIEDGVELAPDEVTDGIRFAYRLRRQGWPYEDVTAVLHAVATLPVAAAYQGLGHEGPPHPGRHVPAPGRRHGQAPPGRAWSLHRRAPEAPGQHHRSDVLERPALAERYIPPPVDELEDELRQRPDAEGERVLAGIKRVLERARAGG